MRRAPLLFSGLLSLVLLAFQVPQTAQIQYPTPTIRVKVEAVNVLITVVDRDGRFLTKLPKERFSVYEDDVEQRITSLATETTLPLAVALMIDTSSSVRLKLGFEKKAAAHFLNKVLHHEDQAVLVEFDSGTMLRQDFTNSPVALINAMRDIQAGGGTALFDAIHRVSRQKLAGTGVRRAIVLTSDGEDLHSRRTLGEAVEAAQRAEATIYAIGTANIGPKVEASGEDELAALTEKTGGRMFQPASELELEEAFSLIEEELRSQYSLVYEPTNKQTDGRFREIKVKISDDAGLSVRHKKGYFAPSR